MGRIKRIIVSISLVAVMVIGGAGTAFAAEPEMLINTASGYEIHDTALDTGNASSVESVNAFYDGKKISISFLGYGKKFEVYLNGKLVHTVENEGSAENPAPWMSKYWYYFTDVIPGASYQIKVVSYSYSVNGDVEGGSAGTRVNTEAPELSNLQVFTRYSLLADSGYMWNPNVEISWDANVEADRYEIWRREANVAWKKLGETNRKVFYDYTAVPGKKYQYRIRAAAANNEYASASAGKWLASKTTKMQIASTEVSLDYIDNVTLTMKPSEEGLVSGYEIWRSTKSSKGYKKVATVAENTYTDKTVKSGTYYYKVRCYYYDTKTGTKVYGAFSSVQPIKLILGDLSITVKQTGNNSVNLQWNKVKGASKYEVWYKCNVPGDAWKRVKTTKATRCKLTGLKNGQIYSFRVKAIRSNNSKIYYTRDTVDFTVGFKAPVLKTPKRTVAVSKQKDTITVRHTIRWNRVYGAKKIRIIGVTWRHYENGQYVPEKQTVLKTLKATATSYTISVNYTNGESKYDSIIVSAVDDKNNQLNTRYSLHELDNVKNVKVKRKSATSATLSWSAVPGGVEYWVYVKKPYMDKAYTAIIVTEDTSVTIYATPGACYEYYVEVSNFRYGFTEYGADPQTVTYNHKLGVTKIKSATNSAARKATIQWSKVTNANKYIVYRAASKNGKYQKVATVKTTTYTDSKLLKGKTYYYKIKAAGTNAAGITVISAFSGVKAVKITK